MHFSDAPEMDIEFVFCSDIQIVAINDIDDSDALAQDPLEEITQIELNPSSAEMSSFQIVSNDSIQSTDIQKNGKFDMICFILCIF